MKRLYVALTVVAVAILVSSLFFVAETYMMPKPQAEAGKPEFYVGIMCGYENVTLFKELIDRTKNFTNLIIIGSSGITHNATLLDEVCDYAYAAGMHFSPYFSPLQTYTGMGENYTVFDELGKNYTTTTGEPVGWIKNATAKYGDLFLGSYVFDEPGGNQMDNTGQKSVGLEEARDFRTAADLYSTFLHDRRLENYLNVTMTYTSDYSLYWYDYKAGYNAVLADFFGITNKQMQLALCRGAATAQDKDWGITITHQSSTEHVLEPASDLYNDLVLSYDSGAKYAVVFDFAQTDYYPRADIYQYEYGIIGEEHLEAMQNFWNYVQQNPDKHGSLKADTALVVPQGFGFGFRDEGDKVWGFYDGDRWSRALWQDANAALNQYGSHLDIVYKDPEFDAAVQSKYDTLIDWSAGTTSDSLPVKNLNSTFGYDTIQEAINSGATLDGDIITVKAGTYRENIEVNKTLTILGEDKATTIIDADRNGTGVKITAGNVTFSGFTVENSQSSCGGIWLQTSGNCTITNNIAKGNYFGIYLNNSASNILKNNEIKDNIFNFGVTGEDLADFCNDVDSSNTVNGKTIIYLANQNGVDINSVYPEAGCLILLNCTNITVQNLDLVNNSNGILLINTHNSTLQNNNVTNCHEGIKLISSENNILKNNRLEGNTYGFSVLNGFVNIVDSSNTLNGKTIIYWLNQHDQTVPANAGFIALVNCSGITVQNQVLADAWQGIILSSTTNSTLSSNQITNCHLGIYLSDSGQIRIVDNNITSNVNGLEVFNSEGNTFTGNTIKNNTYGGYFFNSRGNNLSINRISNNLNHGVLLLNGSDNNVITNNNFDSNVVGIECNNTSNNFITKNTVSNNVAGIQVLGVGERTRVTENTVKGNAFGILVMLTFQPNQLYNDQNETQLLDSPTIYITPYPLDALSSLHEVSQNTLLNNRVSGIMVNEINQTTIADNQVKGSKYGITLGYPSPYVGPSPYYYTDRPCGGITLTRNTVQDGAKLGIGIVGFSDSTVTQNAVRNCSIAMTVYAAMYNTITDNILSGENGLEISTHANLFRRNVITAQAIGFEDAGLDDGYNRVSVYDQSTGDTRMEQLLNVNDVDASNTVNGKSIIYWVGQSDKTVPANAACIILVNCTNITIQNQNLANNYNGILLAFSNHCTITGNNVQNSTFGIKLVCSSYNTIQKNNIFNNQGLNVFPSDTPSGIYLFQQTIATISEQSNDANELKTYPTTGNTITENNIENNIYGINLQSQSYDSPDRVYIVNNTIFHNKFINNTVQAYLQAPNLNENVTDQNHWDNGVEGNYWSDYNGTDTNSDGIGDTTYQIKVSSGYDTRIEIVMAEDHHPLTHPIS
jgi:parallel beta-helix repeat protein